MLKKILAVLAAIGAAFSAIFYVLFQQKKDENKALNEKFENMANNLDAVTEADKAANEVKKENENPSVGVILCASKDDEVVEYALSRSLSPTMVSEYTLKLIDKKLLQEKLKEYINLTESIDTDEI